MFEGRNISKKEENVQEKKVSRRNILKMLGIGSIASLVPSSIQISETPHNLPEQKEKEPFLSENILEGIKNFTDLYSKTNPEIIVFIDDNLNEIEKVSLKETQTVDGKEISAGKFIDGTTILQQRIDQTWLDATRQEIVEKHKENKDLAIKHVEGEQPHFLQVVSLFREAHDSLGQKEYDKKIKFADDWIKHTYDTVSTILLPPLKEINPFPKEISKEHTHSIVLGMIALESRFNKDSISNAGAEGLFQITPIAIEEYWNTSKKFDTEFSDVIQKEHTNDVTWVRNILKIPKETTDITEHIKKFQKDNGLTQDGLIGKDTKKRLLLSSLKEQTRIFTWTIQQACDYFLNPNKHNEELKTALETIKKESFNNDHKAYIHELILPLVINAYNAGNARVKEAVLHYAQTTKENTPKNFEVFKEITNMARKNKNGFLKSYSVEAQQYTPRALALAWCLNKRA